MHAIRSTNNSGMEEKQVRLVYSAVERELFRSGSPSESARNTEDCNHSTVQKKEGGGGEGSWMSQTYSLKL